MTTALQSVSQWGVVAYQRVFARVLTVDGYDDAVAGLWLSQVLFHSRSADSEGWFRRTAADIEAETGISERAQQRVRALAIDGGILETKTEGLPAKQYLRVKWDRLEELTAAAGAQLTSRPWLASGHETSVLATPKRGSKQPPPKGVLATPVGVRIHTERIVLSTEVPVEVVERAASPQPQLDAPPDIKGQPPPKRKKAKWVGPIERDPRLSIYEQLTGYTLNKLQENEICMRVKLNDPLWEETIRIRTREFGSQPRYVTKAIEEYEQGGPKRFNGKNKKEQPKTYAPEGAPVPQGKVYVDP